jgi:glucosamine--fructose-6-phosphate aminotransferase (isomerizing)
VSGFLDDVRAQPAVLRELLGELRGRLRPDVEAAAAIVGLGPDRPLLVAGMGSSLSAGRILPTLCETREGGVLLEDAGELLHYGLRAAGVASALIAISQSGRSYETVRAVQALRAERRVPVVAVVNDLGSPLAAVADVAIPMLAGSEAAIATKTYLSTMAALAVLAGTACPGSVDAGHLDRAIETVAELVADEHLGPRAAVHLGGARALLIVARGPALGAAAYGALTVKEAAALPAEAMSGGAFRHGPLELTGADAGLIVLAPPGRTADLLVGVARETALRGCPTWLITDAAHAAAVDGAPSLLISAVAPDLPESLAPLALAVPLQLAAEALAIRMGRTAGTTTVATKVTDRE